MQIDCNLLCYSSRLHIDLLLKVFPWLALYYFYILTMHFSFTSFFMHTYAAHSICISFTQFSILSSYVTFQEVSITMISADSNHLHSFWFYLFHWGYSGNLLILDLIFSEQLQCPKVFKLSFFKENRLTKEFGKTLDKFYMHIQEGSASLLKYRAFLWHG